MDENKKNSPWQGWIGFVAVAALMYLVSEKYLTTTTVKIDLKQGQTVVAHGKVNYGSKILADRIWLTNDSEKVLTNVQLDINIRDGSTRRISQTVHWPTWAPGENRDVEIPSIKDLTEIQIVCTPSNAGQSVCHATPIEP